MAKKNIEEVRNVEVSEIEEVLTPIAENEEGSEEEEEAPEDSTEPKYTSMMAVHQALHSKPAEFEQTINQLLADRLGLAVDNKREEVANAIFGTKGEEEPTSDGEADENLPDEEAGESEPVEDEEEQQPVEDEEEEAPTEE